MVNYIKAKTIKQAIKCASTEWVSVFVAGGTDVYVNKYQGNLKAKQYIDISEIDELKKIELIDNEIHIGALVPLIKLLKNNHITDRFSAIKDAVLSIATPVIRQTATVGGNLLCENRCVFYNQSEWWRESVGYCLKCDGSICIATGGTKNCFSKMISDLAPVLIAYNAVVLLEGPQGEIKFPLEKLYTGDGVESVNKAPNSLLKSIILSREKKYNTIFKKLRPRKTLDFTSLSTAVSVDEEKNLRIAMSGIDPMPVVVSGNINHENLEDLIKKAIKKSRIVDNDYYSRKYRKEMISVFIKQSLEELKINKK